MPRLVNVKLGSRLGGIQGSWEPDESDRWELYVGMVTRTPLGEFSSARHHQGSPGRTDGAPATALTRAPPLTWHPGRPGGRWAEAIGSRSTGLGGRRILAGTARLTVQKGKNHEPLIVADTATARALRGIQPDGADPAAPVFGLAGETLANRVSAAARAAGLGEDFSGHSGRIGMARRMVAAGAPTAAVQHQGRWKHGDMVARYTRGEAAGEALKWLT